MLYKALVTFTGTVSMTVGEVGVIADPSIAKSLMKVGYIEVYNPEEKPKKKRVKKNGNGN